MKLYNSRRTCIYELGNPIGSGGQASIFRVIHQPDIAVKLYYKPPSTDMVRKLNHMVANPPGDPSAPSGHCALAWPHEVLFDQHDYAVGYAMPLVSGGRELLHVFNPRKRSLLNDPWDWRLLHRTAYNLSSVVGALHDSDYVVGDLNESNVLVMTNKLVTLIDTDSFQVIASTLSGNVVYHCPVGKPEYTPPELQGKDFKVTSRKPEHDSFGLGVLIFQLLMEGNHPFRAQWLGDGDPPPLEVRISKRWFPYDKSHHNVLRPPLGTPGLEELHPELAKLISRCFLVNERDAFRRPSAREWMEALRTAEQNLKWCTACNKFYSGHQKVCPRCLRLVIPTPKKTTSTQPKRPSPVFPAPPSTPSRASSTPRQKFLILTGALLLALLLTPIAVHNRWITLPETYWLWRVLQQFNIPASIPTPAVPMQATYIGQSDAKKSGGASSNTALPDQVTFDPACVPQAVVRNQVPWLATWSVDLIVRESQTITLHISLTRNKGAGSDKWGAQSPKDSRVYLATPTGRFKLLDVGGFVGETIVLEPERTVRGSMKFALPDSDRFEWVHPNVRARFIIDLANRTCETR